MNLVNYNALITTCLLLAFQSSGQQNLILNGDFEEYWECPDDVRQIEHCKNVYNPCENTFPESSSDYFNSCYVVGAGGIPVGVPNTPFAYQEPYSGEGMVGFGSEYNPSNNFEYREYVQLSFTEKLECGKRYKFTGHFNLANYCRYTIKNIGFYFSEIELDNSDFLYNLYSPHYVDSTSIVEDTLNWYSLSFEFVAERPFQYISIGHFYKDSSLSFLEVNPNASFNGYSTYFFLDDCNLTLVAENIDHALIPNIFTPNNDGINDFFEVDIPVDQFSVINRWGNVIIHTENIKPSWNGLNANGELMPDGIYYYTIEINDSPKTGMIQLIR